MGIFDSSHPCVAQSPDAFPTIRVDRSSLPCPKGIKNSAPDVNLQECILKDEAGLTTLNVDKLAGVTLKRTQKMVPISCGLKTVWIIIIKSLPPFLQEIIRSKNGRRVGEKSSVARAVLSITACGVRPSLVRIVRAHDPPANQDRRRTFLAPQPGILEPKGSA
jgi:hypothetical protein